ncbi:MAG TPA: TonB-dependent receptor plug domain-containing protein, partial [Chitinophagaceae bacterium]|nr:TonB-dependent receptor plug domain-containing protein [Chitinophagaceae bacterium]
MKLTAFVSQDRQSWPFTKLALAMKLTSILLLAVSLQVAARTDAQTVSLKFHNAPLKKVLIEVQKQTGLNIFMDEALLEKSGRVTLQVRNMPVQQVLDLCLSGGELGYTIDGTIVVRKKAFPVITNTGLSLPPPAPVPIKGTVTDENGVALRGATIKIKDNNLVTSADAAGNFSLEVPEGSYMLVISYVGFQTQEVRVSGNETVRIVLKQADTKIDEVVVVGYGTKKRANLTGAVEQINGEDIALRPASNISNSLQGLLPGLNIQTNNGNPGALPDINIRGFNSLNGGGPLILIDGIEGDIERVNPADVESITVLKDAASASIYGSQASAGVIIITTKRAKSNQFGIKYSGKVCCNI